MKHPFLIALVLGLTGWLAAVPLRATPTVTMYLSVTSPVYAGTPLSFISSATGANPLVYQWIKVGVGALADGPTGNGSTFAGTSTNILWIDNVMPSDAGEYELQVTEAGGASATSPPVPLAVLPAAPPPPLQPPVFFGSYLSANPTFGTSLTLSGDASGGPTYQWYKNGVVLPNATSSSFQISSVTFTDAGNYTVVATNAAGSATSPVYVVTVTPAVAPAITLQPQGVTVPYGAPCGLQAAASGVPTPTLQWYFNGVAIPNATNSFYVFAANLANAGSYTVAATNVLGSATSLPALVQVVAEPPTITSQPASLSVVTGANASFSVTATGSSSINYVWSYNAQAIPGATSATYTINDVQGVNGGSYAVTVTDATGTVMSTAAVLTVIAAPVITQQPVNVSTTLNSTFTFAVAANPGTGLSYQWYLNGLVIPGATSATYTSGAAATNLGQYTVAVANAAGSVTSAPATLSAVVSPPVISRQPAAQTVLAGGTATMTVQLSGSAAATYLWYFGGRPIAGATGDTLTLSDVTAANTGSYYVVASASGLTTTSNTVQLTVQPILAGTYFGIFSDGGRWALLVNADDSATFLAYLPTSHSALVLPLSINADGSFSVSGTTTDAVGNGGHGASLSLEMAATTTFTLNGQIGTAGVTGQMSGLGETLSGTADSVAASGLAGLYTGSALNGATGTTYAIVGNSGQAFILTVTPTSTDYTVGQVNAQGQLTATSAAGDTVSSTISSSTGTISTTVTAAGSAGIITYSGLAAGAANTAHLVNLSARATVGSGADVLVAGFVIGGSGSKPVLLRGIGPTLATFGVSNTLLGTQLTLFDVNSMVLWTGGQWGGSATLSPAFKQVGAFPLVSVSEDSAYLTSLTAGVYTSQVAGITDAAGAALAEIYDADMGLPATRLVNLSSRANVGSGSNVLIAGLVIGGTGTETVLLRGIGPALANYGIAHALSAPILTLYDQNSNVIASNMGWGGTTALQAAFAKTGAFALSPNSADCALLVTLAPGSYTVQVSGENSTSGVALVEVYEVK